MSRKNHDSAKNQEHFYPALEGFAIDKDIEFHSFGDHGLHVRLEGISATIDCWPTTGKYWIKDTPLNGFMTNHERSGKLPHGRAELNKFLSQLFGIKES